MSRRHDDEPVLITEAAMSFDEEFAARKKRYSLIMGLRIPCLILAGVFGIAFNLPLVAVAFIVLSVPLPWVAVLIANDRMPTKARKVNRYRQEPQGLGPVSERRIIEAAEVLDARGRTDGTQRSRQTQQAQQPRHDDDAADSYHPRTGTDG